MDIPVDPTWKNPSSAQKAAPAMATVWKPKNLTEFETAEMMCLANKSLWYTQAKSWAKEPPANVKDESAKFWQEACQFIVDVVDMGYDEELDIMWPVSKMESEKELAAKLLILMDFGVMLEQYRQRSLDIVSRGFDAFIDIICGIGWEKQYKKFLSKATDPLMHV
jgi:hypothetical protein